MRDFCPVPFPSERWIQSKHSALASSAARTLAAPLAECKRACLAESSFACMSFNYMRTSGKCFLLNVMARCVAWGATALEAGGLDA